MVLTGAIYFPNNEIQYTGDNSSAATACTQIIGRYVSFIGNSTVVNNGCAAAGIEPVKVRGVRILE
jgi:hypothetical protein